MAVQNIQSLLSEKNFPNPVYILHGEEEYFIDTVTKNAEEHVIAADQRAFNQNVFFGMDCRLADVLNACQQFSMFGGRQLIIVKEAQKLDALFKEEGSSQLLKYALNPVAHTCLIISIKGKKIDGKTKLAKELSSLNYLYLSEEVKDFQLTKWIEDYVKMAGMHVAPSVANDINERIGNDLHRIASEIDKLVGLAAGQKELTAQLVDQNVSKAREYNVFDFKKAILSKNYHRAYEMAESFGKLQKSGDAIGTFAFMASFLVKGYGYAQLVGHDRTEAHAIAGIYSDFMAKDFELVTRNYHLRGIKTMLEAIEEADVSLKGADDQNLDVLNVYNNFILKCLEATTPN